MVDRWPLSSPRRFTVPDLVRSSVKSGESFLADTSKATYVIKHTTKTVLASLEPISTRRRTVFNDTKLLVPGSMVRLSGGL